MTPDQMNRVSLEDRIRITKWKALKEDLDAKRFIIIQLPEWIARARRASNQVKAAVIGFTLIGFAIGGFAVIALSA